MKSFVQTSEGVWILYFCPDVTSPEWNLPWLFVPFGILCSKDVHRAVVTGHADERRVLVEINAGQDRADGHNERSAVNRLPLQIMSFYRQLLSVTLLTFIEYVLL